MLHLTPLIVLGLYHFFHCSGMKISWWTPKYPTNMRCHQRYSFRAPKIFLPNLDELPYFPAWFPVFLCSLLCSHFLLWSCNTLSPLPEHWVCHEERRSFLSDHVLYFVAGCRSVGCSWWLAWHRWFWPTDCSANPTACLLLQVCLTKNIP